MMRAASAFTFEIDNPELALADIKKQLAEKLPLLKNTAGILQCDPEFVESGVVSHLCKELGFPIVGGSTAAQATNDAQGDLMLTMLVLTSDDVEFFAAHTSGLLEDIYRATAESLKPALAASALPLRLILTFPPIVEEYAGDWYIEAFERLAPQIPVFGSLAVDDAIIEYDRCVTICNGVCCNNETSYLLVFGSVAPRFLVAAFSGKSSLSGKAIITRAEGNLVHEINGMRAIDFFETVGLVKNGVLLGGVEFIPFLMTVGYGDDAEGLPYVRALIRFDEAGSAICRGVMFEGAEFNMSANSCADILADTVNAVEQINRSDDVQAVLMFSCIVRRMLCGADAMLELTNVRERIRSNIPFMLAYSGGEIAPLEIGPKDWKNLFYNYAFIACLL